MHEKWIKPSQHLFWYRPVTYSGQATIWTKARLLLIGPLGFSGFWVQKEAQYFFMLENQTEISVCVSRHRCSKNIVPCPCWTERCAHTHRVRRRFVNVSSPSSRYRKDNTHTIKAFPWPCLGVTKGITCSHVRFFKSCSCSTGVAAAGLRLYLLNMNDAFKKHPIFYDGWKRRVY